MAIFRPSSIVGAISGNLGASCFVQSRNGTHVRRRQTKVRKRTAAVLSSQASYTDIINTWHSIDPANRQAWTQASRSFSRADRLGRKSNLSPLQYYLHMQMAWHSLGLGFLAWPPDGPAGDPPYWTTFSFTAAGPYTIDWSAVPADVPQGLFVYGSRPVKSRPQSWYRSWRLLKYTHDQAYDSQPEWDPILGPLLPGEFVGIKLSARRSSARISFPMTFTVEVQAP